MIKVKNAKVFLRERCRVQIFRVGSYKHSTIKVWVACEWKSLSSLKVGSGRNPQDRGRQCLSTTTSRMCVAWKSNLAPSWTWIQTLAGVCQATRREQDWENRWAADQSFPLQGCFSWFRINLTASQHPPKCFQIANNSTDPLGSPECLCESEDGSPTCTCSTWNLEPDTCSTWNPDHLEPTGSAWNPGHFVLFDGWASIALCRAKVTGRHLTLASRKSLI